VPLPTEFNTVQAIIGGLPAPFFYVSKTQLVIQIPSELPPNRPYSALLVVDNQVSLPQTIVLVPATPGTVAFPDGTLVAQHADYRLVTDDLPAKPGEPIRIYLVGMGSTDPPVASGSAAPSDPLARVAPGVRVTVDGEDAKISYAGLTPGGVGLYQIDFTVPDNARSGKLQVVITQNGVPANITRLTVAR
jgi:uncharacterized protein (TIGR03437 family)